MQWEAHFSYGDQDVTQYITRIATWNMKSNGSN